MSRLTKNLKNIVLETENHDELEVLEEKFFKKEKTYLDKLANRYPQYEKPSADADKGYGFGAAIDSKNMGELKKRITGGLAAAVGNNNVRAQAGKSIKTFPILVDENIEDQTIVYAKNYVEMQYAELISQIVSNQIIDVTQFDRYDRETGSNIAIQALDSVIGSDAGSSRDLTQKALAGKLTADDVLGKNPLYNLIKREGFNFVDENLKTIFENAIITTPDKVGSVIDYIKTNDITDVVETAVSHKVKVTDIDDVNEYEASADYSLFEATNIDRDGQRPQMYDAVSRLTDAQLDAIFTSISTTTTSMFVAGAAIPNDARHAWTRAINGDQLHQYLQVTHPHILQRLGYITTDELVFLFASTINYNTHINNWTPHYGILTTRDNNARRDLIDRLLGDHDITSFIENANGNLVSEDDGQVIYSNFRRWLLMVDPNREMDMSIIGRMYQHWKNIVRDNGNGGGYRNARRDLVGRYRAYIGRPGYPSSLARWTDHALNQLDKGQRNHTGFMEVPEFEDFLADNIEGYENDFNPATEEIINRAYRLYRNLLLLDEARLIRELRAMWEPLRIVEEEPEAGEERNETELLRDTLDNLRRGIAPEDEDEARVRNLILRGSVADVVLRNPFLSDRFTKAFYLLNSMRISVDEFADYLNVRLGIPVSGQVMNDLRARYTTDAVHGNSYELRNHAATLHPDVKDAMKSVFKMKAGKLSLFASNKTIMGATGLAAGAAAGTIVVSSSGLGVITAALGTAGAALGTAGVILGTAGVGAAAGLIIAGIAKILKRNAAKRARAKHADKKDLEGWRRCEMLIESMDDTTFRLSKDAVKYTYNMSDKRINTAAYAELRAEDNFHTQFAVDEKGEVNNIMYQERVPLAEIVKFKNEVKKIGEVLMQVDDNDKINRTSRDGRIVTNTNNNNKNNNRNNNNNNNNNNNRRSDVPGVEGSFTTPAEVTVTESLQLTEKLDFDAMIVENEEMFNEMQEIIRELKAEKTSTILQERRVKMMGSTPINVRNINYDDTTQELLPSFGTKSALTYGSVEYDRRELKDRRYNQPLILTVKFKERYSDGKYADNELVAVIGILGKVTRIPTEEMEYVLKTNANGNTVNGIFAGIVPSKIGTMLANLKKDDYDNLPQSGDAWADLERIKKLAITNQLSGKKSGNVANAHIIISQKVVDTIRQNQGVDYLRDKKVSASLMKRYSAMTLMVANDTLERMWIFDDLDANSWTVVPYSAIRGKDDAATYSNILQRLR